MNRNVNILLATYNGSAYIENQILSLIGQTHRDWTLLIHDDGSIDDTLLIIKRYQAIDKRIELKEDGIVCGGAAQNFLHLLQYVNAEYIICCDQDDVWFEKKIELLLNELEVNKFPCAVYCNAYGYDGEDIITDSVTLYHRTSLQDSLFLNGGVQGCSLMFNKELLDIMVDRPEYVYMHDHYFTIAAIVFGKLQYIDKFLMFYRQHANNVTGNIHLNIWQRIKTFFTLKNTVIEKRHFAANVSFYDKFNHLMTVEQKMLFQSYIAFPNLSLIKRLLSIYKNNFKIGKSKITLLIKTLIRQPV